MQHVLSALKDIPGVLGSFVLTPQGALAGREMPAIYPDDIFPELGRRLATIGEVLESQMGKTREMLMKFEGYWVFVRHTAECLFAVLVAEATNFPALRMATNVALKQITDQLKAGAAPAAAAPAEATAPTPASAPPVAVAKVAPTKPQKFWRGRPVD
jgi:predicted regulator of Ras-like GTPase activity (Roadblock/LC7/MglB family)